MKKFTKILNKIYAVLLVLAVLGIALSIVSFAAEDTVEEAPAGTTEVTDTSDITENEYPDDFWGRVLQIFSTISKSDFTGILNTALNVLLLIISAVIKKGTNKSLVDLDKSVTASQSNLKSSVTDKFNELISSSNNNSQLVEQLKEMFIQSLGNLNDIYTQGMNALRDSCMESIEAFKSEFAENVRQLCATYSTDTVTKEQMQSVVEGIKATLEIFNTIYQHSSTVPDVIKQQVAVLRGDALKNFEELEGNDGSV